MAKQAVQAESFYREALEFGGDDPEIRVIVGLNRLHALPKNRRAAPMREMSRALDALPVVADAARYHLNLGTIAMDSGELPVAWHHLELARRLAKGKAADTARVELESLDALATLYETQGQSVDALTLTQEGLAHGRALDRHWVGDVLISLEWRQARLAQASGETGAALAAYMRAIELIENIRQDLPIEYADGRSSFRVTLEPIYLGYVDLLLRQLDGQPASLRTTQLRSVIETLELIKQAELQDFLGDRCAVEAVQGGSAGQLPAETAVLYPVLLPDRLELLLQTPSGIARRTVAVGAGELRMTVARFASLLRGGVDAYAAPARQLYTWLLLPFDALMTSQKIAALVVVPDGALRLVPFAALHDGQRFAIEKFAISVATGLSMTNTASPQVDARSRASLIAGLSEPGSVVEKLTHNMTAQIIDPDSVAAEVPMTRGLAAVSQLRSFPPTAGQHASGVAVTTRSLREIQELKTRLALPGVKTEVDALTHITQGTTLLNEGFSIERFRNEAATGSFRILHIASHGVFGGSSETSFIMAHDDVLTINDLQSLLHAERFQKHPIELLTLSACQTAEGNDRSPLGISGAAIKARAKSVLGTLWPVEDNAARKLMEVLYGGLINGGLSKTEALRQAQIALLHSPESAHPFFWAPFVLIGNWR
jgi:CHAT domain-containing protein